MEGQWPGWLHERDRRGPRTEAESSGTRNSIFELLVPGERSNNGPLVCVCKCPGRSTYNYDRSNIFRPPVNHVLLSIVRQRTLDQTQNCQIRLCAMG